MTNQVQETCWTHCVLLWSFQGLLDTVISVRLLVTWSSCDSVVGCHMTAIPHWLFFNRSLWNCYHVMTNNRHMMTESDHQSNADKGDQKTPKAPWKNTVGSESYLELYLQ